MTHSADTIAAIATARGKAALAIIRLSGSKAVDIAEKHFKGKNLSHADSHTAHVGYFIDREGEEVDQVVVTVFRAPSSVTGEDVVEISCHGGTLAPQLILRELLSSGPRLAEPGEFTQRGFLNGKIDLAQAEAVGDLIHASSSLAHRVSVSHLQGRYSEIIQQVRSELLKTCALIELELDFSEEDVDFADRARFTDLLNHTVDLLSSLLNSYRLGAVLRDGVRVVIGGRPNAGKSTLMNALLGRDRAIVSPVPGTTRDEIEAEAELDGVLYRFTDTAGLRETSDAIEAEGVRRTQQSIGRADILLYVYDVTIGLDDEEIRFLNETSQSQPELNTIVIGNKTDLEEGSDIQEGLHLPSIQLSALRATGSDADLEPLRRQLIDAVRRDFAGSDSSPVVVNQRHRQHIAKALEAVTAARTALEASMGGDALALDLRVALHELGSITGEISNEDILGKIFSSFCIGK